MKVRGDRGEWPWMRMVVAVFDGDGAWRSGSWQCVVEVVQCVCVLVAEGESGGKWQWMSMIVEMPLVGGAW